MARGRKRPINLRPPYLKRVWLDTARVADPKAYPFSLPFLKGGFELDFDRAMTIIVGENGTGKSTLLEAIADLAGYDQAGGDAPHPARFAGDPLPARGRGLAKRSTVETPSLTLPHKGGGNGP
jgi:hypothetical protein